MATVMFEGVNGSTCDAQQYRQNLPSQTNSNPSILYLTHGQSIGLALTAQASCISFVSILLIVVMIARNILRHRKAHRKGDLKLLRTPADVYMFSLFMFDTIQATGGILNVLWAHDGQVRMGFYCSAQGTIKQIGATGTALITLILAVHTFIAALWGSGIEARGVAFGLVSLTCVYIVLWVGINNFIHKDFVAPAPYWCWINSRYPGKRLVESVCLWITLFASVVVWYKFHWSRPDQKVEYAQRRASLGMLSYPLAYSFVVLPLSVARWSHKYQHDVPSAALFFGQSTFNLSGTINVLLFLTIRPELLLFTPPENPAELEGQIYRLNAGSSPSMVQGFKADLKHKDFPSEGSSKSEAPSRIGSMQRLDDI